MLHRSWLRNEDNKRRELGGIFEEVWEDLLKSMRQAWSEAEYKCNFDF